MTEAQLAKDKYQCMRETGYAEISGTQLLGMAMQGAAAGAQGNYYYSGHNQAAAARGHMFYACMEANGYKLQAKTE